MLITGAGSGTGAAAAIALASTHDVVLVGRRADRLEHVAAVVREAGGDATAHAFDVASGDAAALLAEVGEVTDLVLAAGANTPRRTWADQHMDEFADVVATNLLGTAKIIDAALPGLRRARGMVVVVSSRAGWTPSPVSGVAYRASKTALRELTMSLNEQESEHGVRACHLCPGDIDTEFLDHRPAPPPADARRSMLHPADVARAIAFVVNGPPRVRIEELVISPVGTLER